MKLNWGHGIFITLTLFIGMMAWFMVRAIGNQEELVTEDYYKEEPQFHMWPDPTAARYEISRFGPVGIGLELIQREPVARVHMQPQHIRDGALVLAAVQSLEGARTRIRAVLPVSVELVLERGGQL